MAKPKSRDTHFRDGALGFISHVEAVLDRADLPIKPTKPLKPSASEEAKLQKKKVHEESERQRHAESRERTRARRELRTEFEEVVKWAIDPLSDSKREYV